MSAAVDEQPEASKSRLLRRLSGGDAALRLQEIVKSGGSLQVDADSTAAKKKKRRKKHKYGSAIVFSKKTSKKGETPPSPSAASSLPPPPPMPDSDDGQRTVRFGLQQSDDDSSSDSNSSSSVDSAAASSASQTTTNEHASARQTDEYVGEPNKDGEPEEQPPAVVVDETVTTEGSQSAPSSDTERKIRLLKLSRSGDLSVANLKRCSVRPGTLTLSESIDDETSQSGKSGEAAASSTSKEDEERKRREEEALRSRFKAGKMSGWLQVCSKKGLGASYTWKPYYCILTPAGNLRVMKDEKAPSLMEFGINDPEVEVRLTNAKKGKKTSMVSLKNKPKGVTVLLASDTPQLVWDWYNACKELARATNPYQLLAIAKIEAPARKHTVGLSDAMPLTTRSQMRMFTNLTNEYKSTSLSPLADQLNALFASESVVAVSVAHVADAQSRQALLFQSLSDLLSDKSESSNQSSSSSSSLSSPSRPAPPVVPALTLSGVAVTAKTKSKSKRKTKSPHPRVKLRSPRSSSRKHKHKHASARPDVADADAKAADGVHRRMSDSPLKVTSLPPSIVESPASAPPAATLSSSSSDDDESSTA